MRLKKNIQVFKFDDQDDVVRMVDFSGSHPDVQQWVDVSLNRQTPVDTIELEDVEEDLVYDLMTKKVHLVRHKGSRRLDFIRDEKPKNPRK